MRAACAIAAGLTAALGAPAGAQLMDLSEAASEAVSALEEAAQDAVLVGDLIGAEATGPAGERVGSVSNLVALPGGTLIAALIAPDEGGEPLVVPFKALKLSMKADAAGVTLPESPEALRGTEAATRLSQALGGLLSD